jgi:hypothetical protein
MLSSGEIASVPITKYNCNQNILDKLRRFEEKRAHLPLGAAER